MTLSRLVNAAPILALLAVLGTVAARAAPVVWHWRGDVATEIISSGTISPAAAPIPAKPVDIGPLLTLAPFGAPPEQPAETTPIGETTLDLTLLGIVLRSDPAQSRALISTAGISGQYGPGNPITDRASLVNVAADHVILDVDGSLQTLSFPAPDGTAAAQSGPISGTDRLLAAVTAQPTITEPPPETTQDYIDLWRDRIIANPGEVLTAIGLIPSADGYVIAEQHDSGVRRAGLRAGDLVKTVNGQAVGNVEQDRQLYDDIAASGMARIEIERDGRTIVMSFPLQ